MFPTEISQNGRQVKMVVFSACCSSCLRWRSKNEYQVTRSFRLYYGFLRLPAWPCTRVSRGPWRALDLNWITLETLLMCGSEFVTSELGPIDVWTTKCQIEHFPNNITGKENENVIKHTMSLFLFRFVFLLSAQTRSNTLGSRSTRKISAMWL